MEVDVLNNRWFKDTSRSPTTTVADGVETTIGQDPFATVSSRSTLHRGHLQYAIVCTIIHAQRPAIRIFEGDLGRAAGAIKHGFNLIRDRMYHLGPQSWVIASNATA